MEDEERVKRLKAGKEKLAAFRKKRSKKKKRLAPDGGADGDMSDTTASETSSVVDPNDIGFTSESDQGPMDASEDESYHVTPMALHKATDKLHKASSKITELEESLVGKQYALDSLLQENEKLKEELDKKASTKSDDQDIDFDLPNPDAEDISEFDTVDKFKDKLEEFKSAVVKRDEVIRTMSSNLQSMTDNRDTLQAEYMAQAEQLAQQVQFLQAQLKQAGAHLDSKGISVHLQALSEAKNELLALQSANKQKEDRLLLFQDAVKQRDDLIHQLSYKLQQTAAECHQLRETAARQASASSEQGTAGATSSVVVEGVAMDAAAVKKVVEDFYILKQHNERKGVIIGHLEAANASLKSKDKETSQVVVQLMEDVEKLKRDDASGSHRGAFVGTDDMLSIEEHKQQLAALRAELDETFGEEIFRMKEQMRDVQTHEVDRLREELKKLFDDRNKLSQQVTIWQQQYVSLSQQNVSNTDLCEQIGSLTSMNVDYRERVSELEVRIETLTRERDQASVQYASSKSSLERLETVSQCANCKLLKGEVNELNASLKKARQECGGLESKLSALQTELLGSRSQLESLRDTNDKEVASWKEKFRVTFQDNHDLNAKLTQAHTVIQQLQQAVEQQVGQDRSASHFEQLLEQYKEEIVDSRHQHEFEVQSLKIEHFKEIENLSRHYADAVSSAGEKVKAEHQGILVAQGKDYEELLDKMKAEHEQEIFIVQEQVRDMANQLRDVKHADLLMMQAATGVQKDVHEITAKLVEVSSERDSAVATIREISSQNNELKQRIDEMESEKKKLDSKVMTAAEEKVIITGQLNETMLQRDELNRTLEQLITETENVKETLHQSFSDKFAMNYKMKELSSEKSTIESELVEIQNQRDVLMAQLDYLANEREMLQGQMTEWTTLRESLLIDASESTMEVAPPEHRQGDTDLIDKLRSQFEYVKLQYTVEMEKVKQDIAALLKKLEESILARQTLQGKFDNEMAAKEEQSKRILAELAKSEAEKLDLRQAMVASQGPGEESGAASAAAATAIEQMREEYAKVVEQYQTFQGHYTQCYTQLHAVTQERDTIKTDYDAMKQYVETMNANLESKQLTDKEEDSAMQDAIEKSREYERTIAEWKERHDGAITKLSAAEDQLSKQSLRIIELSEELETVKQSASLANVERQEDSTRIPQLEAQVAVVDAVHMVSKAQDAKEYDGVQAMQIEPLELVESEGTAVKKDAEQYVETMKADLEPKQLTDKEEDSAMQDAIEKSREYERTIAEWKERHDGAITKLSAAEDQLSKQSLRIIELSEELETVKQSTSLANVERQEDSTRIPQLEAQVAVVDDAHMVSKAQYAKEYDGVQAMQIEPLELVESVGTAVKKDAEHHLREHIEKKLLSQDAGDQAVQGPQPVQVDEDLSPSAEAYRICDELGQKMEFTPEPSPARHVDYEAEVDRLKSQLDDVLKQVETMEDERERMKDEHTKECSEVMLKINSLLKERDDMRIALQKEIKSLKCDLAEALHTVQQKVAEREEMRITHHKLIEQLRLQHSETLGALTEQIGEVDAEHGFEMSGVKKNLIETKREIEGLKAEKEQLEHEFLTEMESANREHDTKLKQLQESYEQELDLIRTEVIDTRARMSEEQQELTTQYTEEVELLKLECNRLALKLQEVITEKDSLEDRGEHLLQFFGEDHITAVSNLTEELEELKETSFNSASEIERLRDEIHGKKQEVESLLAEKDDLEHELKEVRHRIEGAPIRSEDEHSTCEVDELRRQLEDQSSVIDVLRQENCRLEEAFKMERGNDVATAEGDAFSVATDTAASVREMPTNHAVSSGTEQASSETLMFPKEVDENDPLYLAALNSAIAGPAGENDRSDALTSLVEKLSEQVKVEFHKVAILQEEKTALEDALEIATGKMNSTEMASPSSSMLDQHGVPCEESDTNPEASSLPRDTNPSYGIHASEDLDDLRTRLEASSQEIQILQSKNTHLELQLQNFRSELPAPRTETTVLSVEEESSADQHEAKQTGSIASPTTDTSMQDSPPEDHITDNVGDEQRTPLDMSEGFEELVAEYGEPLERLKNQLINLEESYRIAIATEVFSLLSNLRENHSRAVHMYQKKLSELDQSLSNAQTDNGMRALDAGTDRLDSESDEVDTVVDVTAGIQEMYSSAPATVEIEPVEDGNTIAWGGMTPGMAPASKSVTISDGEAVCMPLTGPTSEDSCSVLVPTDGSMGGVVIELDTSVEDPVVPQSSDVQNETVSSNAVLQMQAMCDQLQSEKALLLQRLQELGELEADRAETVMQLKEELNAYSRYGTPDQLESTIDRMSAIQTDLDTITREKEAREKGFNTNLQQVKQENLVAMPEMGHASSLEERNEATVEQLEKLRLDKDVLLSLLEKVKEDNTEALKAISLQLEDTSSRLEEANSQRDSRQRECDSLSKEMLDLRERTGGLEDDLHRVANEYEQLCSEKTMLERSLHDAALSADKLQKVNESLEDELRVNNCRMQELSTEWKQKFDEMADEKASTIKDLNESINNAKDDLATLEMEKETLAQSGRKMLEEFTQLKQEYDVLVVKHRHQEQETMEKTELLLKTTEDQSLNIENLRGVNQDLENTIVMKTQDMKSATEDWEAEKDTLRGKISGLSVAKETLESERIAISAERDRLVETLNEKHGQSKADMETDLAHLQSVKEQLERDLTNVEHRLKEEQSRYFDLDKSYKELSEDNDSINTELHAAKKRKSVVEEELERIKEHESELSKVVQTLQEKVSTTAGEMELLFSSLDKEKSRASDILSQLDALEKKDKANGLEMEQYRKKLEDAHEEKSVMESRLEDMLKSQEKKDDEIRNVNMRNEELADRLTSTCSETDVLKRDAAQTASEKVDLENKVQSLQREVNAKDISLQEAEKLKSRYDSALSELNAKVQALHQLKSDLESDKTSLSEDKDRLIAEYEAHTNTKRVKMEELQLQLELVSRELQDVVSMKDTTEATLRAELEEFQSRTSQLESSMQNLKSEQDSLEIEMRDEMQKLKSELQEAHTEKNRVTATTQSKLDALLKELEQLRLANDGNEDTIKEMQVQQVLSDERHRVELDELNRRIQEKDLDYEELRKDHHCQLLELNSKVTKLETENSNLSQSTEEAHSARNALEQELAERQNLISQKKASEIDLNKLISTLSQEKNDLIATLEATRQDNETFLLEKKAAEEDLQCHVESKRLELEEWKVKLAQMTTERESTANDLVCQLEELNVQLEVLQSEKTLMESSLKEELEALQTDTDEWRTKAQMLVDEAQVAEDQHRAKIDNLNMEHDNIIKNLTHKMEDLEQERGVQLNETTFEISRLTDENKKAKTELSKLAEDLEKERGNSRNEIEELQSAIDESRLEVQQKIVGFEAELNARDTKLRLLEEEIAAKATAASALEIDMEGLQTAKQEVLKELHQVQMSSQDEIANLRKVIEDANSNQQALQTDLNMQVDTLKEDQKVILQGMQAEMDEVRSDRDRLLSDLANIKEEFSQSMIDMNEKIVRAHAESSSSQESFHVVLDDLKREHMKTVDRLQEALQSMTTDRDQHATMSNRLQEDLANAKDERSRMKDVHGEEREQIERSHTVEIEKLHSEYEVNVQKLNDQVEVFSDEMAEMSQTIARLHGEKDVALEEFQKLLLVKDQEIKTSAEEKDQLHTALSNSQRTVESLNKQLADLMLEQDQLREDLTDTKIENERILVESRAQHDELTAEHDRVVAEYASQLGEKDAEIETLKSDMECACRDLQHQMKMVEKEKEMLSSERTDTEENYIGQVKRLAAERDSIMKDMETLQGEVASLRETLQMEQREWAEEKELIEKRHAAEKAVIESSKVEQLRAAKEELGQIQISADDQIQDLRRRLDAMNLDHEEEVEELVKAKDAMINDLLSQMSQLQGEKMELAEALEKLAESRRDEADNLLSEISGIQAEGAMISDTLKDYAAKVEPRARTQELLEGRVFASHGDGDLVVEGVDAVSSDVDVLRRSAGDEPDNVSSVEAAVASEMQKVLYEMEEGHMLNMDSMKVAAEERIKLLVDDHDQEVKTLIAENAKLMDNIKNMNESFESKLVSLARDHEVVLSELQDQLLCLEQQKQIFSEQHSKLHDELGKQFELSITELQQTIAQLKSENSALMEETSAVAADDGQSNLIQTLKHQVSTLEEEKATTLRAYEAEVQMLRIQLQNTAGERKPRTSVNGEGEFHPETDIELLSSGAATASTTSSGEFHPELEPDDVAASRISELEEALDHLQQERDLLRDNLEQKDQVIGKLLAQQLVKEPAQESLNKDGDLPPAHELLQYKKEIEILKRQVTSLSEEKNVLKAAFDEDMGKVAKFIQEQEVSKATLERQVQELASEQAKAPSAAIDQPRNQEELSAAAKQYALQALPRGGIFSDSVGNSVERIEQHLLGHSRVTLEKLQGRPRDEKPLPAQENDGAVVASSGQSDDITEIRQHYEGRLDELKQQHETEIKVLEFSLAETHAIEAKRMRAEIEQELEDGLKGKQEDLDFKYQQQVECLQRETELRFVKELREVRQQLESQHQEKIDLLRRQYEESVLHQVTGGDAEVKLGELVGALQRDRTVHTGPESELASGRQELIEGKDALLKQIDTLYHQREELQEEILNLNKNSDRLAAENSQLAKKLEEYDADSSVSSSAENTAGEEWRVRSDKLLRETKTMKARLDSRRGEEPQDDSVEGLQIDMDEDLQVKVHELQRENKLLRLRLEDQNLAMQESLQEELMAMYSRYDALVRENRGLLSCLNEAGITVEEAAIVSSTGVPPEIHHNEGAMRQASTEQDSSTAGFMDWKLQFEALRNENLALRSELDLKGVPAMASSSEPRRSSSREQNFEKAELVSQSAACGPPQDGSSRPSSPSKASLSTCDTVFKEYDVLKTHLDGLMGLVAPEEPQPSAEDLTRRLREASEDKLRQDSELADMRRNYQELIAELEDLKSHLNKSKDKAKKDYTKMKAKALATAKQNETLKTTISTLEGQISALSPDSASDMIVPAVASGTGASRGMAAASDSVPVKDLKDCGTDPIEESPSPEMERQVLMDNNVALLQENASLKQIIENYKVTKMVPTEERLLPTNVELDRLKEELSQLKQDNSSLMLVIAQYEDTTVREQLQKQQDDKSEEDNRNKVADLETQYKTLLEEHETLKTKSLSELQENYDLLVRKHDELEREMQRQSDDYKKQSEEFERKCKEVMEKPKGKKSRELTRLQQNYATLQEEHATLRGTLEKELTVVQRQQSAMKEDLLKTSVEKETALQRRKDLEEKLDSLHNEYCRVKEEAERSSTWGPVRLCLQASLVTGCVLLTCFCHRLRPCP